LAFSRREGFAPRQVRRAVLLEAAAAPDAQALSVSGPAPSMRAIQYAFGIGFSVIQNGQLDIITCKRAFAQRLMGHAVLMAKLFSIAFLDGVSSICPKFGENH
jgi:hypothetical protein